MVLKITSSQNIKYFSNLKYGDILDTGEFSDVTNVKGFVIGGYSSYNTIILNILDYSGSAKEVDWYDACNLLHSNRIKSHGVKNRLWTKMDSIDISKNIINRGLIDICGLVTEPSSDSYYWGDCSLIKEPESFAPTYNSRSGRMNWAKKNDKNLARIIREIKVDITPKGEH